MADYNLGTAEGTIKIGYDGKGITQAGQGMDTLEKKARNVQRGFQSVATTTGVAATAIAGGIALAVNSAIDFEKQISAIGSVSGATTDQLEVLRRKALQLGADTAFSASEAALAMEELAKAGLSVEEIMNGAADATVALAAAGQVSLPEAATIASNAMNQFNLAASDLPRVADLIAGAANASAIDVGEFGLAMSQAGAVANLVGVNFDDLATAIALMGNAGIKGSDAGTSLKTMLQNLQPTTRRQIDLMTELGILTEDGTNQFFNQQGELRSLAEVSGILNTALADMTDQQKAMALETIFGTDAIRAAAILTGEGADGFNEMAAAMGEVTAEAVAAARLDNVAGSIEQLKGSVETAAIAFGTALLPAIRAITEFVTLLVNKFTALDPKWQRLIAFAAVAAAALIGLIAVIAGVGAVIAGLVASVAAIKIAAIISAIVLAVIAIAAAIKLAYDRSQEFRDFLAKLGQVARAVFGAILAVVMPIVQFFKNDFLPAVKEIAQTLARNLQPAFKAISEFISARILPAVERLKIAFEKVMPTIISVGKIILEVAKFIFNVLGKALGFIIPLLLKIIGPIFSVLIAVIANVIEFIPKLVSGFKTFLDILKFVGKIIAIAVIAPLYLIYQVGKFVFEQIMAIVTTFVNAFMAVWNFLWPGIKAVWDLIVAIVQLAFAIIGAIFQAGWLIIKAIWDTIWDYVVKPVMVAFNLIANVIKIAIAVILGIINAWWDTIRAIWAKIDEWVVQPVVRAFNTVRDWISDRLEDARQIARNVWNLIAGIFTAARDRIVGIARGFTEFVNNIRTHFENAKQAAIDRLNALITFIREIPGRVVAAIGDLSRTLYNAGRALITGFWDGVRAVWNSFTGWISDRMDWLRGLWPFSPAKHGPFSGKGWLLYSGRALMEGFARGIDQRVGTVDEAARRALATVSGNLPTDFSATVEAATRGAGFAGGFGVGSGTPPASTTTTTTNEINLNVPLEDLRSIRDVQDLLDFIDRLRNDSRRGLEVSAA